MKKLEKLINRKFNVHVNIFKAGGRIIVLPEKGYMISSKKMTEIRECILLYSNELEDNDNETDEGDKK